jgi:hypothetical protein
MKEKKIPTIIAIVVLIIALAGGVFLIQNGSNFFLKASPDTTPNQIRITNVNTTSLNISWITEKETGGFVRFGETESLDQTYVDDRDQESGQTGAYQTHYVTIRNLKVGTNYFFKISSDGTTFDNSGKPYEVTTAPTVAGALPENDVAAGTVVKSDKTPGSGTIVYLTIANMSPQSALVGQNGSWIVPLNTALSSSLNSYALYDKEAQVVEIFVQGVSLGVSTAVTTTKNDNPVNEIVLGKTYDFRQSVAEQAEASNQTANITPTLIATVTPAPGSRLVATITPTVVATVSSDIKIISPTNEENIATQKPEIFGTGPASKTLTITIHSAENITATVTTDKQGNWTFTPPTNLSPGEHTVTLAYGGKTVTKTFVVLAAGETSLPAFTATPSGTRTTPTPTKKLTPTPTKKATLTPSIARTSTATATATPTSISRTSQPSTSSGLPTPGNLTPTFIVFIMGLLLVSSGFIINKILAHAR